MLYYFIFLVCTAYASSQYNKIFLGWERKLKLNLKDIMYILYICVIVPWTQRTDLDALPVTIHVDTDFLGSSTIGPKSVPIVCANFERWKMAWSLTLWHLEENRKLFSLKYVPPHFIKNVSEIYGISTI